MKAALGWIVLGLGIAAVSGLITDWYVRRRR